MGEGRWSGGRANRTWSRFDGARVVDITGDRARGQRLTAELADEIFWCETCHGTHPLTDIRLCREGKLPK